jgi:hypothetical protein
MQIEIRKADRYRYHFLRKSETLTKKNNISSYSYHGFQTVSTTTELGNLNHRYR